MKKETMEEFDRWLLERERDENAKALAMKKENVFEDVFDERANELLDLLLTREADEFAKALDANGWRIVPKPQFDDGERWTMNEPCADCPAWADIIDASGTYEQAKKPPIRLVTCKEGEAGE
jgi:hypothetical protein